MKYLAMFRKQMLLKQKPIEVIMLPEKEYEEFNTLIKVAKETRDFDYLNLFFNGVEVRRAKKETIRFIMGKNGD